MNHPRHPDRRRRPGFTLVEILVVITILGILVALLVPAITGAIGTARNAQVTGEINTIAQALASFKTKYGDFPPSRIILNENGNYETTNTKNLGTVTFSGSTSPGSSIDTTTTVAALCERSLLYLRKFFPRAPFRVGKFDEGSSTFDFNGDGDSNDLILIDGHECLVFFLGGIPSRVSNPGGDSIGMTGFGNNPQNPFVTEAAASNRQRPMFEFKGERLIDDDGDGIPGYIDPLGSLDAGRYYAYFSAHGGGGYDPNDVNIARDDDSGLSRPFRVNFANIWISSPPPNPYTSSSAAPNYDKSKTPSEVNAPLAKYHNNETYQIISAGGDRFYGFGGWYTPGSSQATLPDDPPIVAGDRSKERDNLTNFATSRLD
jgi:prepilin-type N-terminal cleavage/methylation domain-containing protein